MKATNYLIGITLITMFATPSAFATKVTVESECAKAAQYTSQQEAICSIEWDAQRVAAKYGLEDNDDTGSCTLERLTGPSNTPITYEEAYNRCLVASKNKQN